MKFQQKLQPAYHVYIDTDTNYVTSKFTQQKYGKMNVNYRGMIKEAMAKTKSKIHASHVLMAHAQLLLTSLPAHVTASSYRLRRHVRKPEIMQHPATYRNKGGVCSTTR